MKSEKLDNAKKITCPNCKNSNTFKITDFCSAECTFYYYNGKITQNGFKAFGNYYPYIMIECCRCQHIWKSRKFSSVEEIRTKTK